MRWNERLRKVFTDRQISALVRDARHRPYSSWEGVLKADPNYADMEPGQIRFLKRMISQSEGIVMVRHAPPLDGVSEKLEPIFAELRPLDAVVTSHRRHNFIDKNGKHWDHHIGVARPLTAAWQKHVDRDTEPEDHGGKNRPDDHLHVERAKYLFPPGPFKTVTEAWADGTVHEHRVKDRSRSRAKRLDVHPLALPMFADAERVYFALEGCLKADSILTEVLRTGERASVFSVPSVTLWDCFQHGELHAFVQQYLRGKRVIIVPDSDWEDPSKDGAVISQALYCRTALTQWGVQAHVAAPTPGADGSKRGIDDYLADGGRLADLPVIDRQSAAGLFGWTAPGKRLDGQERTTRLLAFLALHASEGTGEFHAPLQTIARRARIDRKAIREDLVRLVDAGALATDKPLRTATYKDQHGRVHGGTWVPWPTHNPYLEGGFYRDEIAWASTPTLTVDPLFRATTDRSRTVGDL